LGLIYIYIYIYIYTYIYLEMALFMLLLFEGLILLEILGHCLIGPMGELAILANYMYGNFKDVYWKSEPLFFSIEIDVDASVCHFLCL